MKQNPDKVLRSHTLYGGHWLECQFNSLRIYANWAIFRNSLQPGKSVFSAPAQHTEQFVPPSTHLDPRKAFKRGPGLGSSPTAIILQAAGTCSSGGGGRFCEVGANRVQLNVTGRVKLKRRFRGKRDGRGEEKAECEGGGLARQSGLSSTQREVECGCSF